MTSLRAVCLHIHAGFMAYTPMRHLKDQISRDMQLILTLLQHWCLQQCSPVMLFWESCSRLRLFIAAQLSGKAPARI